MTSRKATISEAQITKAVMDTWRKLGLPGTRVASIPNQRAAGQYGLTKGVPDLLVIAPGLPLGLIELKTETGKLSPEQQAFKVDLIIVGAPYRVTYGLDQALACLRDWHVIRSEAA
jgi:hypothetical protein